MQTLSLNLKKKSGFLPAVLLATLVAGTIDICAASLQYFIKTGKGSEGVLKFVASGVFGKSAFSSAGMVMYGLLFRYIVAFGFALVLFLIYPTLKSLLKYNVLIGILFGIAVWLVMNLVVVPLTNAPLMPLNFESVATGLFILIVAIGFPLSYFAEMYYKRLVS